MQDGINTRPELPSPQCDVVEVIAVQGTEYQPCELPVRKSVVYVLIHWFWQIYSGQLQFSLLLRMKHQREFSFKHIESKVETGCLWE